MRMPRPNGRLRIIIANEPRSYRDALAGVISDMATLAVRLDKPLTARLMPIPGKQAGDEVAWDFFSIRKGPIMALKPRAAGGLFAAAPGVEFGG